MSIKMRIWAPIIVLGVALVWGLVAQHFTQGGSGSDCPAGYSCSAPSGGGGYDPHTSDDRPVDHPVEMP